MRKGGKGGGRSSTTTTTTITDTLINSILFMTMQTYMAPFAAIFVDKADPENAMYNNFRVYGTMLLYCMGTFDYSQFSFRLLFRNFRFFSLIPFSFCVFFFLVLIFFFVTSFHLTRFPRNILNRKSYSI